MAYPRTRFEQRLQNRKAFFRPIQQGLVLFTLCALVLGLAFALFSVRWIILALLIGVGFGVLIMPVVGVLSRRLHLKRPIAVGILVITLVSLFGGVAYFAATSISEQFGQFQTKLPEWTASLDQLSSRITTKVPFLSHGSLSGGIGGKLGNAALAGLKALQISATALGGLFFILATGFYLAAAPEEYVEGSLSAFPAYLRPKAKMALQRAADALRSWFGAQLIAMAVVGVLVSAGLKILGSDYWLLLGLVTAVMELVPFLGPIVSFIVAGLATLASQPDKLLPILIFYLVILRVEADIVIPLVMRGRIKLPPIPLLLTMLVLGEWFGVLGFFAAAPLVAVGRALYLLLYVPKMDQKTQPIANEAAPTQQAS